MSHHIITCHYDSEQNDLYTVSGLASDSFYTAHRVKSE